MIDHFGWGSAAGVQERAINDHNSFRFYGGSIVMGYPNSWMVYKETSENNMDDFGAPFMETPI